MTFNCSNDIKSVRTILNLSQEELAECLDVERVTISRNELGTTEPSSRFLETFYSFAFHKGIKLNVLKEMFFKENLQANEILLFHGSKSEIEGKIDVNYGRSNNDFGHGFYTGESYKQAVSFVSGYNAPSVYILSFKKNDLRCRKYEVDQEWMMTIAYYRGALEEYRDHPKIKSLVDNSRDCDYIISPIADNRMFQIIDSFIAGELTDEQCKHCLAATNLGMQYVFISERAVSQISIMERCYISDKEREYYKKLRIEDARLGDDKVKLAKKQYRGLGKYIDEILS